MLSFRFLSLLFTATALAGPTSPFVPRDGANVTFLDCLSTTQVEYVTLSSDPAKFKNASTPYNWRFRDSIVPAAIIFPLSASDVSVIVRCMDQASDQKSIPLVARSGGHSYAAYGLGGDSGAAVVDLSNLKKLELNVTTGWVVSGTGNRLGDLAQGIWDQGKRALPHGTCPYVGTGGHASYGGFGLLSRSAGLLMDTIVEAEVVTANGTIVTASESNNPDLFWALRGAAPSYGIVTAWTFATVPAPTVNTNFKRTLKAISGTELGGYLSDLQTFSSSSPPNELTLFCSFGMTGTNYSLSILGSFDGNATALEDVLTPLGPLSNHMTIYEMHDWLDALTNITGHLNTSTAEKPDNFLAKSVMSKQLDAADVTKFVNWMDTNGTLPDLDWWIEIDLYGGRVSSVAGDATAYANRDATLTWQFYGSSPLDGSFAEDGGDFMTEMVSSIFPEPEMAYPNYVDPTLSDDQWQKQYFGANYKRLVQLKEAWDPKELFKFPQSIPLSTLGSKV